MGSKDFAAAYDAALGEVTHRFVNRDANLSESNLDHNFDDYVTLVPPSIMARTGGYYHAGRYRGIFAEAQPAGNGSDYSYFAVEVDSNSMATSVKDALAVLEANVTVVIQRHALERYTTDLSRSVITHPGVDDKDLCVYEASVLSMVEWALETSYAATGAAACWWRESGC